jgi:transcriptional regulator with XRE-family HTH domain
MKDRISQIMYREQLTPAKFAEVIGIQRSAMSHIMTGRNNPSLDVIKKILEKYPYIDPDWLLSGKGSMMRNDIKPKQLDMYSNAPSYTPVSTPKVTETPENRRKIEAEKPQIILKQPIQEQVVTKKNESKNVSRVMIFYSDNTYETFVPEKIKKD